MKKIYEVNAFQKNANGEEIEGWGVYLGTDYEAAKAAYEREIHEYDYYLTEREKKNHAVNALCYEVDDTVDETDEEELVNAICEAVGADELFPTYDYEAFKKKEEETAESPKQNKDFVR